MVKRHLVLSLVAQYFLTMTVPAFIALFYAVKPLHDLILNFLHEHNFYSPIRSLEVIIVVMFYIIVPTLIAIYNYRTKRPFIDKQYNELTTLIFCIDQIVDEKAKRYYSYPKKDDNFLTYIRPDYQIAVIKEKLSAYFRGIYDDLTINSDLFYNENGELIHEGQDEPLSTSMEIVNNPNSTAKTALKLKKIVIVPDTSKKNAHFVADSGNEKNSIFCYPIIERSKVKYIISVSSKIKDKFRKEDEKRIEFALESFSKRIKLESYLKPILELNYGKQAC